jgi:hypothetical protein
MDNLKYYARSLTIYIAKLKIRNDVKEYNYERTYKKYMPKI